MNSFTPRKKSMFFTFLLFVGLLICLGGLGTDINAYYMSRCYHEAYGRKAYILGNKPIERKANITIKRTPMETVKEQKLSSTSKKTVGALKFNKFIK